MKSEAREDFDMAMELFAELLDDKLEDVEFEDDFEPDTFLLETVPAMVDAIEAAWKAEVLSQFNQRDPNNASKMREVLE